MKIDLVDDTALIGSSSISNKPTKFLGFAEKSKRKEATAIGNNGLVKGKGFVGISENMKREYFGGNKGERFLGFAEIGGEMGTRFIGQQDFGGEKGAMMSNLIGNVCGKKKGRMGFGENLKWQEVCGDNKEMMGSDLFGCGGVKGKSGKGKRFVGVSENMKVQGFGGNGCVKKGKRFVGFTENLKWQEVKREENGGDAAVKRDDIIRNGGVKEKTTLGVSKNVKIQERGSEDMTVVETSLIINNGREKERKVVKNQETVLGVGNEKDFLGLAKKMSRIEGFKKGLTTEMVEYQYVDGTEMRSNETKCMYSRKEMEALRFANEEDQKKKWDEVYCGFIPNVRKEYDSLSGCNLHQKKHTGLSSTEVQAEGYCM